MHAIKIEITLDLNNLLTTEKLTHSRSSQRGSPNLLNSEGQKREQNEKQTCFKFKVLMKSANIQSCTKFNYIGHFTVKIALNYSNERFVLLAFQPFPFSQGKHYLKPCQKTPNWGKSDHTVEIQKSPKQPKFDVSISINKKSVQQCTFQKVWKIALSNCFSSKKGRKSSH